MAMLDGEEETTGNSLMGRRTWDGEEDTSIQERESPMGRAAGALE